MKKTTIILTAVVILISACNQRENKGKEMNHSMSHDSKNDSVMMEVMDESMMAMHHAKQTGNADYDFAAMMIPHHEGAIKMSEIVVSQGKSKALIDFSKKVIAAQKMEIQLFNDFLKGASQKPASNATQFKKDLAQSMKPMMDGMANIKRNNDIDKDFVVLMIPHHQSAVEMAKAYLPYSTNPKIKLVAQQIISTQEEEIKWLQKQ